MVILLEGSKVEEESQGNVYRQEYQESLDQKGDANRNLHDLGLYSIFVNKCPPHPEEPKKEGEKQIEYGPKIYMKEIK